MGMTIEYIKIKIECDECDEAFVHVGTSKVPEENEQEAALSAERKGWYIDVSREFAICPACWRKNNG